MALNGGPWDFYTLAIKQPINLSASNKEAFDYIELKWKKDSDIPDANLRYRIYRDSGSSPVATISGNGTDMTWKDLSVNPGESHSYRVTSYTPDWGGHESAGIGATGYTKPSGMVVSQGTYQNRVNITWTNLSSFAENVKVMRSIPGVAAGTPADITKLEELEILNKNATAYNDYEAVPGFKYSYYIFPVADGRNFTPTKTDGYRAANGIIKGTVKSKFGAAVAGVTVTVTKKTTTIPLGAITYAPYTATTDETGYYEIKGVYYYDASDFEVSVKKGTHVFTKDKITRRLDLNTPVVAGVDFTDETVFTVQGKVKWPSPSTCGIKGVDILINGQSRGVLTDALGNYKVALQDEGTYTFTPQYLHHGFTASTQSVTGDIFNLNFDNKQTDTLKVIVQGGCQRSVAETITVQLTNNDGGTMCFTQSYTIGATGVLSIPNLPARSYSVKVLGLTMKDGTTNSNIMYQFANKVIQVDLSKRDTVTTKDSTAVITYVAAKNETLPNGTVIVTPARNDTTYKVTSTTAVPVPTAEFIYRAPVEIKIDYAAAGVESACSGTDQIKLMDQGVKYRMAIYLAEKSVNGIPGCPINSGKVTIYNFVGDEPQPITLDINEHGYVYYDVIAGSPEIATSTTHNHQKLLYLKADIGFLAPVVLEDWFLVQGSKVLAPSFITRSPDLPMIVMHDPPGDKSFATISKGTTFSQFQTSEVLVGGEAGLWANLLVGAKVLTPFSSTGAGAVINFKAVAGRDNFNRSGMVTTITFNDDYSTSPEYGYVGNNGDVFIGAAFNQEFSFAEELTFDKTTCTAKVRETASMSMTDFATTFIYTERHIKETLLPLLENLRTAAITVGDTLEANRNTYAILAWKNILEKNNLNRTKDAEFQKNISFSAGAAYTNTATIDVTASESYEYAQMVNTELALGAKITNEAGAWFDSEFGVTANFRWSTTTNKGTDNTTSQTVSYHLEDDDSGDFFSVDVLKDKARGVPAFFLKSGTSSCPNEEGTQARDKARIQVFPPTLSNVPLNTPAVFRVALANQSQSKEGREYKVKVISTTNPDGAIVKLGGQIINSEPATYYLEYNQVMNVALTIERGPLASVYEGIKVIMYPSCDEASDGFDDGSSTTEGINVYFQSQCTSVALQLPGDGWKIIKSNNNKLNVSLTGYDKNNPSLQSVSIEYRRKGEGWSTPVTYLKASGAFDMPFIDFQWDVTNLPDGEYDIRATASCGENGTSTSSIQSGIIDRTSIAPFGSPTPADGYLAKGGEISVSFDKPIYADLAHYDTTFSKPVITLVRKDTGANIPITVQISGQKLIIQTNPASLINTLEGVELVATVANLQDLSKNIQKYPVEWAFKVNATPIFWDPAELVASAFFGKQQDLLADLKNASKVTKLFSITGSPTWLTPKVMTGAMLPENSFSLAFTPKADLAPGIYTGTITAEVDDKTLSLPVKYELLAIPPAWKVNPANYQYSMNIVAQLSLTDANAPLSSDVRDAIGVFVNGTPRGTARIEFVPGLNVYAAFITVYSNEPSLQKETLNFRMWNALTGIEYGAKETTYFVPDGTLGTAKAPYILHLKGILQTIPLNQGWNWVSLNVSNPDMTLKTLLSSIATDDATKTLSIKSQTQFSQYSASSGWVGSLSTLNTQAGYLLYLSHGPDTLRIVGSKIAAIAPLPLSGTWNWIGYPRNKSSDVNESLKTLTNKAGAVIKSPLAFATYESDNSTWVGSLKSLTPGMGYKLKMTGSGVLSQTQNQRSGNKVNAQKFEFNMTVTALVYRSQTGLVAEDQELYVFIDGVARGVAQQEYLPGLNAYRTFLTLHGDAEDNGKLLEFKLINPSTGEESSLHGNALVFSPDQIVGSVSKPFELRTTGTAMAYELGQNYPNPFKGETSIRYSMPERQAVRIVVYNQMGAQVKVLVDEVRDAGNHEVTFSSGTLPSGIYLYKMVVGEHVISRKMVVVR
ncbi:T9SS type A sorting domain-containing protein [Rufibacter radiotolerans]|uniref:T9SS type A sorting domain-containing protein n=1 Tax=Rufibacter radiotolerans TaxID=1379910 RepID=UPI0018CEF284|nr:T9SS type A sorting domain-containing protein [Rufibacter radiotolerans]